MKLSGESHIPLSCWSVECPSDCGSSAVQSLLDDHGLADVSSAAEAVKEAVEQQQFVKATELWSVAETVIEQVGTVLEDPQYRILFDVIRCTCTHRKLIIVFICELLALLLLLYLLPDSSRVNRLWSWANQFCFQSRSPTETLICIEGAGLLPLCCTALFLCRPQHFHLPRSLYF